MNLAKKIKATGATFVSVDRFLPELSEGEMERLKNISTTEMTIQAIRTTCHMNDFLDEQFKELEPDVVYTDSVCFWGKLAGVLAFPIGNISQKKRYEKLIKKYPKWCMMI